MCKRVWRRFRRWKARLWLVRQDTPTNRCTLAMMNLAEVLEDMLESHRALTGHDKA